MFAEIPFEPVQQYSASIRIRHDEHVVFVKGAPERVLGMCTEMLTDHGPVPLEREARRPNGARARRPRTAGARLRPRVRWTSRSTIRPRCASHTGWCSSALQAMIDPPRAGVKDSIATCQSAGIRVVMITGDHVDTAPAIADQLGIETAGSGSSLH